MVDPESLPILTNLLRAAIEPTRVKVGWPGLRPDLRQDENFPHVILRLNGFPEAITKPSGQGSVTICLGAPIILASFPRLASIIESFSQEDTYEIESLLNFRPSKEIIDEVFSFLAVMHWCESADWASIPWSEKDATTIYVRSPHLLALPELPPRIVLNVARLTSWHEVAHWHMERLMTGQGRTHFESQTAGDLKEWLSQHRSSDPDWDPGISPMCQNDLKDPETARSWIREICADQLGTSAALTVAGAYRDPYTRAALYTAIAMYFFSIELVELYDSITSGRPDYSTHPPARVRRSVTTYILRKKTRLPEKEFMSMEWGAGLAASSITREIVTAAAEKVMADPGHVVRTSLPWLRGSG